MSDCQKFEADLSALIDGELAGDRQAAVIEHVDHCSQCSRRVAELQRVAAGIRGMPVAEAPPGFLADVRRQIRGAEQPAWVNALFRPLWLKVPLEAFAVLLLVAGISRLTQPSVPPRQELAKATPAPMRARILAGDRLEIQEEKRADAAGAVFSANANAPGMDAQFSAPLPAAPAVALDQLRAELPETLVVRGEPLLAVKLRAEMVAQSLNGRVENATATNAFRVMLPVASVSIFRAQMTKAKAGREQLSYGTSGGAVGKKLLDAIPSSAAAKRSSAGATGNTTVLSAAVAASEVTVDGHAKPEAFTELEVVVEPGSVDGK